MAKARCAFCGKNQPTGKLKLSVLFRPGSFICKDEMACQARAMKKKLPLPARLLGFPIRGGTPEAGCGGLHLAPGVFEWPAAAELVASVPAHRACMLPPVDGTQVQQFKSEVGSFAYDDHMVDLTCQEPARYPVIADVAHRAVLCVHQCAQFLPPETTPAHRGHNRKDRHGR